MLNTADLSTAQTGRQCLTELPSELLDDIFKDVYSSGFGIAGICETLLPFQRRQVTCLRLPDRTMEEEIAALLPFLGNLTSLACKATPNLPSLLALLPNPLRLKRLAIDCPSWKNYPDSSTTSALSAPLSKFSNLEYLHFDCIFDLGPEMRKALQKTSLQHLEIGSEGNDELDCADFIPLVSGPERLPHLKTLELNFVYASGGQGADHVAPGRPFDTSTWRLPWWPDSFDRSNMEKLIAVAVGGIKIEGYAVDALDIEASYKEEFERGMRKYCSFLWLGNECESNHFEPDEETEEEETDDEEELEEGEEEEEEEEEEEGGTE
jgi:hypothetical protein